MEYVFFLVLLTTLVCILVGSWANCRVLLVVHRRKKWSISDVFPIGMAISDIFSLVHTLPAVVDGFVFETVWGPVCLWVWLQFFSNLAYFIARFYFFAFAGVSFFDIVRPKLLKNHHCYVALFLLTLLSLLLECDFLFVNSDLLLSFESADFLEWENRIRPFIFDEFRFILHYGLLCIYFSTFICSLILLVYQRVKITIILNLHVKEHQLQAVYLSSTIFNFLQLVPESGRLLSPNWDWKLLYLFFLLHMLTYVANPFLYLTIKKFKGNLGEEMEREERGEFGMEVNGEFGTGIGEETMV